MTGGGRVWVVGGTSQARGVFWRSVFPEGAPCGQVQHSIGGNNSTYDSRMLLINANVVTGSRYCDEVVIEVTWSNIMMSILLL